MKGIRIIALSILSFCGIFAALAERYYVETGQFEKLKVNGNLSVIYKNLPDSTGMAFYDAPADNEDVFVFSTKNDGSLKVEPSEERWGRTDLPVVHLFSDFLSSVESYSDQSVEISSLAPCASFNVNLIGNGTIWVDNVKSNNVTAAITTGNGSIYINGVCVNANFRMVGAGLISADRLKAETIKCRILGTGSIGCWPTENLNVTGLGSTKIYYKGSPNIKKRGGGKLFELPEEVNEEVYAKLGTPVVTAVEEDTTQIDEEEDDDVETEVSLDDDDEDNDADDDFKTIVTSDD